MKETYKTNSLGILLLITLSFALFSGAANAAPPAPINNIEYMCSGGDWQNLKFDLPLYGNLRSGIVFKNGDNRKADIANKNNIWEFTFVNGLQCKELYAINKYRQSRLFLRECADGIDRFCFAPR